MLYRHAQFREEREMAHIQDYRDFNNYWDTLLLNITQEDEKKIDDLAQKHSDALELNRFNMENKLSLNFKFSPELLNQQKI